MKAALALALSVAVPAYAQKPARSYAVTPTITADAYAQGDQIGGLTKLTKIRSCSGCPIRLDSLTVIDKSKAKDAFDVLFFTAEVTPASDNAAVDFTDADMASYAGKVAIAAADFADTASNSYATKLPALLVAGASGSEDLWMALVCTDAGGCDWASTSDLVFRLSYLE